MSRTFLVLSLFSFGCMEQGFSNVGDKGDGDGPEISVTPSFLDFGELGQDDEAVVQTFVVESVGATDLDVSGIEIAGNDASSFTILTESLSFTLPPGTSEEIEVAFLPFGAQDQLANAVVSSDDPDDGMVQVELLGAGSVPELEITPDPLDFGITYIGCDEENYIDLANVGTDSLTIQDIEFAGANFTMTEDYALPIELQPGELTTLTVVFNPDEEADYTAELKVTSNEPMGQRTADQTGAGQYGAEYIDSWEIPSDPPSDIIFSVDQSCSMDDDQVRLANNFSKFISELSSYSNDWQIMVVNDDNGCNNTGILTPSVSSYESKFSQGVKSGGGWYTEALLTVGANAVEATDGGECNDGFLREDAMLHIIQVSDEPEQSQWTSGETWDTLVQRMIDKKGSASNVKVSAIAGDYPSGCASADAGSGYYEAVAATGGVFLSICGDWATTSNLQQLAEASINQDTFELTHDAVEETIEVQVNGDVRSTWTYDSDANEVTFTEKIPGEGDLVDISYAAHTVCD